MATRLSRNNLHLVQKIKATDFKVVHFFDEKAQRKDGQIGSEVILIYALGEDGIIREYANGKWVPFPII
jgi:hypothetical protein